MLIYKKKFLTYFIFLTYLYFWWAWPKGDVPDADRQKYRQTDRLKTARGRGAPIPVLITFRCLRLIQCSGNVTA